MLKNKYTPLFALASLATIALFVILGISVSKNIKVNKSSAKSVSAEVEAINKTADSLKKANDSSYVSFNKALSQSEIVANDPNSIEYQGVKNVHELKTEVEEILTFPNTNLDIANAVESRGMMDQTIDALKIPKEKNPRVKKEKKERLKNLVASYASKKLRQQDLANSNNSNTTDGVNQTTTDLGNNELANTNIETNTNQTSNQQSQNVGVKNSKNSGTTASNKKQINKDKSGILVVKGGKLNNIKFDILQDQANVTETANQVKSFTGTFDFEASKDIMNNIIYIIITTPDGQVLRNSDWDVTAFKALDGERKIAGQTFKFDYKKGTVKPINFSFNTDGLQPGNYTFEIYHHSLLLHKYSKYLQ
jgi:hypothetical protein